MAGAEVAGGSCWNHSGEGPPRRGFGGVGRGAMGRWPEQEGEKSGSKGRGVARMGQAGRLFWNTRLVRQEPDDQPGHQAKLGAGGYDRHWGATDLSKPKSDAYF